MHHWPVICIFQDALSMSLSHSSRECNSASNWSSVVYCWIIIRLLYIFNMTNFIVILEHTIQESFEISCVVLCDFLWGSAQINHFNNISADKIFSLFLKASSPYSPYTISCRYLVFFLLNLVDQCLKESHLREKAPLIS